jgi:hypothetical protein
LPTAAKREKPAKLARKAINRVARMRCLMSLRSRCYPEQVLLDVSTAQRHRNGRGLYLGDQPSKRHRYDCAQYRESNRTASVSRRIGPRTRKNFGRSRLTTAAASATSSSSFTEGTELSLCTLRAVETSSSSVSR